MGFFCEPGPAARTTHPPPAGGTHPPRVRIQSGRNISDLVPPCYAYGGDKFYRHGAQVGTGLELQEALSSGK